MHSLAHNYYRWGGCPALQQDSCERAGWGGLGGGGDWPLRKLHNKICSFSTASDQVLSTEEL